MSIALTVTGRLLGSGVVVQLPSVWRGRDLAPHQLSMKCRRILTHCMNKTYLVFLFVAISICKYVVFIKREKFFNLDI